MRIYFEHDELTLSLSPHPLSLSPAAALKVPYVTLVQHDAGLAMSCSLELVGLPNLLVLSAGGNGHVPVPLLKQREPRANAKPLSQRTHRVSYVGR